MRWNEGMPKAAPPAAGMRLIFADDFRKMPPISSTVLSATYYDHKPPNGSQDFSSLPFIGIESPNSPFSQVDSYLRIQASEKAHSSGLLSSEKNDGSGIKASLTCYFEYRFIGPTAIGTWPAFWLLTDYLAGGKQDPTTPVNELDIIEAYGGEGPHEPNSYANYQALHNPCTMHTFGIPSTWYQTFHTYGCKIPVADTIYYCDNIEVGGHPTQPAIKKYPFFFLINLAAGGGWPVDLSRYGGMTGGVVDKTAASAYNALTHAIG